MGLKEKLTDDLKKAMRQKDEVRKSTIRLVMAEIRNAEIERRGRELDDDAILAIIAKEAKRRKDSIAEFKKGGREDLVEKEEAELRILLEYLPKQLSREEIEAEAIRAIEEVGAKSIRQLGEVMRILMPRMKGRANGRLVSQVVKGLLIAKEEK
jgi:hypothetical protein